MDVISRKPGLKREQDLRPDNMQRSMIFLEFSHRNDICPPLRGEKAAETKAVSRCQSLRSN